MNGCWVKPTSLSLFTINLQLMERRWMKDIDLDNDVIPQSKGFKLIGIRLYSPEIDNPGAVGNVKIMQKSLYGRKEWIYINDGFTIEGEVESGFSVAINDNAFDAEQYLYGMVNSTKVSVSAIVGKNGTGKSTVADMILRTINNFSAAILGEDFNFASAQHLHYIDNVYASVAVYLDNKVKILTVKGRKVWASTIDSERCDTVTIMDGGTTSDETIPYHKDLHYILADWFYLIVTNYSLYAYNYRDYEAEKTSLKKLSDLFDGLNELDEEDYYWLKGVFHKNDGYQTPVVVHPMRESGYINASKENKLGKNNLVNLAFYEVKTTAKDGHTETTFPLRIINNTHEIVGFKFNYKDDEHYEGFLLTYIGKLINRKWDNSKIHLMESKFLQSVNPICQFWARQMMINPMDDVAALPNVERQAWEYVAYKTIKIIQTYLPYKKDWEWFESNMFDTTIIDRYIHDLLHDRTHRTKKLRQQLAFVKLMQNKEYYALSEGIIFAQDIDKYIKEKEESFFYLSEEKGRQQQSQFYFKKEELLPPPIADVSLIIVRREDKKRFMEDSKSVDMIPFSGLSSGERQIAYTLGNILYHLINVNSTTNDQCAELGHVSFLKYKHVCMLMDEVELYFHPDLQRRFVKLLIDSIASIPLESICDINITMVTHSPFVLSDIPKSNILCLQSKEATRPKGETFGANIVDMLSESFFMDGTIGELAQHHIDLLVDTYFKYREEADGIHGYDALTELTFRGNENLFDYVSSIVGEEYLQRELREMFEEMANYYHNKQ